MDLKISISELERIIAEAKKVGKCFTTDEELAISLNDSGVYFVTPEKGAFPNVCCGSVLMQGIPSQMDLAYARDNPKSWKFCINGEEAKEKYQEEVEERYKEMTFFKSNG